jgi:3-oxoacyl-[acyl-carrier-protein] synthase II
MSSTINEKPDLINAHATSTPMGDYIEIDAIRRLGLEDSYITANKSQLGHSMGAAGAIEAALSVLSIKNNIVTPSINIDNIEDGYNINYVSTAHSSKVNTVLCNSFGFGGTNSSILFRG